jgi:hypothetical protein
LKVRSEKLEVRSEKGKYERKKADITARQTSPAVSVIRSRLTLVVKMATSSLASVKSGRTSSSGAKFSASMSRSHILDSRASFRTIELLAVKSRREYAAFASS